MAMRLGLVTFVSAGVVALVVACGSDSPNGNATNTTADGGPEGGDGSSTNNGDGATPGSACDAVAAARCGTTRKCDPALGCVECLADGDCTAAGRDPFCILGRCEACRTNTDCGAAAPSCYPGDHQCHRSCAVDGGARCDNNTPICDTATGACIGCNTATDCPATDPLCEPTTKSCVECTTNTECPAAQPRCRIPRFECVECLANADCPANQICSGDNHCEPGCTSDQACAGTPNTPKCNTATGQCAQCIGAADCAAAPGTPFCEIDRGRCVQCVQHADCGDAGTPFCKGDKCVQCRNDNDCPGQNGNCKNGVCE